MSTKVGTGFHALRAMVRQDLYGLYSEFVAAFRMAVEKLRSGDRNTAFPIGSFPPHLPFVRARCRPFCGRVSATILESLVQNPPKRPPVPPVSPARVASDRQSLPVPAAASPHPSRAAAQLRILPTPPARVSAPAAVQRQVAPPPRGAIRLAPPPLPPARVPNAPAPSVQVSPSRLPAPPSRPGQRVIQGRVAVSGAELDVEQIQHWLRRSAINIPSGEAWKRIVAYVVGKPDLYEYGEYDALDFIARLQRVAKAVYTKESPKMTLGRKLLNKAGSFLPLEASNLIGGLRVYLAGQDYLRALVQYEKLQNWARLHQEWLDVAGNLTELRAPVEEFVTAHGTTQEGRRVTDLWRNVTTWEGGGFRIGSDLSRYGDWIQRIRQAMRNFQEPSTNIGYTDPHLSAFHTRTREITTETSASTVHVLAKINGAPVVEQAPREGIQTAMERPDTSSEVVNTTTDGEVVPLSRTLEAFIQYLGVGRNQTTEKRFEVAISGSWGACDGCKKRINEFVRQWAEEARSKMNTGVAATLRVTYRYLNRPKGFKRDWGTTTYGWDEDNRIGGAYFHTVDQRVVGN